MLPITHYFEKLFYCFRKELLFHTGNVAEDSRPSRFVARDLERRFTDPSSDAYKGCTGG